MKEKNTMKDNNMNIMEQIILREGPDSNSKRNKNRFLKMIRSQLVLALYMNFYQILKN